MASSKTRLTELGTAAGLLWEPAAPWPDSVEQIDIPGIPAAVWQPVVLEATRPASRDRALLLAALDNGRTFRQQVLQGRVPGQVVWSGGGQNTWMSDIPRDLTVDGVWFIQAKYDSTCVLNTAPATLVDDLLRDEGAGQRPSWYEEVAPRELQAYWRIVRGRAPIDGLPSDVRDLDRDHRLALKHWMRSTEPSVAEHDAYLGLCRAVSEQTAQRWRRHLAASSPAQRTQLLFRMLRIAGGPYWLLGTKGAAPVRLAVTDTRSWRERFVLRKLTLADAHAGQPQVNWRAEIADGDERHVVDGYCEIRWSHGKLQGHPECKVQVTTPLADIPGYAPLR